MDLNTRQALATLTWGLWVAGGSLEAESGRSSESMPAPAKTSDTDIVAAALSLIDQQGAEQLSMQAVAAAVGVRGPSLYKRFSDRASLLRAVEDHLFAELGSILASAAVHGGEINSLREMAFPTVHLQKVIQAATRSCSSRFAYSAAASIRFEAARPVLETLQSLLGESASALIAARTITAFCHGFVSMELSGAFRLGGDVEAAFAEGITLVLAGLAAKKRR